MLAMSGGWALPHEAICWISERHHVLARDELGRLHSPHGPACMYPDGWAIYAVHGVLVPEYVIARPNEISVSKIDSERNAEVRRVMLDRYGWERYLRDSGAKAIQRDRVGELYRKEIPGDEPLVMVRVLNSTPEPDGSIKPYMLRVPPDIQTARDAVAWTFGMKGKDYAPQVET